MTTPYEKLPSSPPPLPFETGEKDSSPSPSFRFLRVYLSALGFVVTTIWTLLAVHWHSQSSTPPRWRHGNSPRAWIRTVSDNHSGLGSVIGQHRMAAVLADMFNSTLVVPRGPTGHGYSVSDYLNNLLEVPANLSAPCLVSQLKWEGTIEENVQKYCKSGTPPVLKTSIEHCSSFLDDREWDYRRDLALCTMEYLDAVLDVPDPQSEGEGVVTVAIHVRWGDTEGRIGFDSANGDPDARSVNQQTAIKIVDKIRNCVPTAEVSVFKEHATDLGNLTVIEGAKLRTSPDMMDDLRRIAASDIRITALGGFASLVHWGAKHGLSLTPTTSAAFPQFQYESPRISSSSHEEFLKDKVSCEDVVRMARSTKKVRMPKA